MTETGMILSNPLHGERRPGFVGNPMPGVDVQLVDESGRPVSEGAAGEIEVRGPLVFLEYLGSCCRHGSGISGRLVPYGRHGSEGERRVSSARPHHG